jgi:RNA polymerase sigma-70 factor (ECF subfamily)
MVDAAHGESAPRAVFRAVYREHQPALLRAARRMLLAADAEAVVQEVLFQFWQHPERYDPARGSLRGYLLMACRNRSIDLVRSESARRRRELEDAEARPPVLSAMGVDRRLDIDEALAQLPRNRRDPILLAFFGDLTYADVARRLGVPEGTVKTRIREGLRQLGVLLVDPAIAVA